jgi:hypothetical protein
MKSLGAGAFSASGVGFDLAIVMRGVKLTAGAEHVHVLEICRKKGRVIRKTFPIGNNRGRINGWIGQNGIYGRCVRIE